MMTNRLIFQQDVTSFITQCRLAATFHSGRITSSGFWLEITLF